MMEEHGLIEAGWRFRFDKATSRLGACHFHKKEISISRLMTQYADEETVLQTLIHEVAHALLPSNVHHGKAWKAMAASLGYTGERLANNPYVDAQLAGLADGPYARKLKKFRDTQIKQTKKHIKTLVSVKNPVIAQPKTVGIGSRLRLPDGSIGVVETKSRNCWRVRSSITGKLYAIAFQHATMLVSAA